MPKKIVAPVKNPIEKVPSPANPIETLGNVFARMAPKDRETVEKILLNLLQKEDVEIKTEIQMPRNFTRLEILAYWAELEGAPKVANILNKFCNLYRINMVSHDRKSREEIIRALSESFKRESSMSEKLMEPPV